eukprot:Colp12_sorted_trinity150504_noHs@36316
MRHLLKLDAFALVVGLSTVPEAFPRVLISDFGECALLSQLDPKARKGNTGTVEYVAPELLVGDEGGDLQAFDVRSDMWSLGVVLYLLCYSRLPWAANLNDIVQLNE